MCRIDRIPFPRQRVHHQMKAPSARAEAHSEGVASSIEAVDTPLRPKRGYDDASSARGDSSSFFS